LCNTVQQARTTLGKFKILLRSFDLSFFETHQEDLVIGLDALCDCNKKEKPLKEEDIKDFLEALKQLIELRKILFPSGTLTSATRKKTTIVMAVIDDRYIEAIRKKTKYLEKLKKEKKPKADITEVSKELDDLKES